MDKHFRIDLKLDQDPLDSALFAMERGKNLRVITASYVDGLLYDGRSEMKRFAERTKHEFEMDDDEYLPLKFTGTFIRVREDVLFTADQNTYVSKKQLPDLDSSSNFKAFSSAIMSLAWLSHTILEFIDDINQVAQLTE